MIFGTLDKLKLSSSLSSSYGSLTQSNTLSDSFKDLDRSQIELPIKIALPASQPLPVNAKPLRAP